jgi:hypothetical protein
VLTASSSGPARSRGSWVDLLEPHLGGEDEADVVRELVLADRDRGITEQMLEVMPKIDHPATLAVLEAIGRDTSDKRLSKVARKAAFKVRSRPSAPAAVARDE